MTRLAGRTAVKLTLGSIEIIATDLDGGGTRRIVKHHSIGVDGADLQDMGEDARVDTYNATVSDEIAADLEALRKDAKKITITHPLFGSYEGRIESLQYKASSKSGVDVVIKTVEDGVAATRITGTTVSLPSAAGSARAAWSDASDAFDTISEIEDLPGKITDAIDAIEVGWEAFDGVLTAVESGVQTWRELSASAAELGGLVQDTITAVDDAISDVTELAETALEDSLYPLMQAANYAVDAARETTAKAWQTASVAVPSSIGQVARMIYGRDDDAACDLVASYLPDRIDYAFIDAGTRFTLPVDE